MSVVCRISHVRINQVCEGISSLLSAGLCVGIEQVVIEHRIMIYKHSIINRGFSACLSSFFNSFICTFYPITYLYWDMLHH